MIRSPNDQPTDGLENFVEPELPPLNKKKVIGAAAIGTLVLALAASLIGKSVYRSHHLDEVVYVHGYSSKSDNPKDGIRDSDGGLLCRIFYDTVPKDQRKKDPKFVTDYARVDETQRDTEGKDLQVSTSTNLHPYRMVGWKSILAETDNVKFIPLKPSVKPQTYRP